MEKTPSGTSVGVDDPYEFVGRCDHLTDEGRCRFAVEQGDRDPGFADARSAEEFRCPVAGDPDEDEASGPWEWDECPHFRCRNRDRRGVSGVNASDSASGGTASRECARCGLEERRMAHSEERPLLEEHHLSYRSGSTHGDGDPSHEITVYLCRWCHAKVHDSWARVDDDANPDPEAIAEQESRRAREQDELGFESAADRFDREE
ncbi:DUF7097 family protein [Halorientalis salina]|uniref:DUF7097 family protein n=1 Tax=Halorientalis salina TaxID=2932266 RepID=UPI0010AB5066|nr:hypothetical protein [Halorientalis salina]